MPISRAREVFARARALPGLAVHGVDMHIGSQITDLTPFDNAFALLPTSSKSARRRPRDRPRRPRRRPRHPLPGRQRPAAFPGSLRRNRRAPYARLDCRLILEPGRLIVGNAGVLVASVIFVKKGEDRSFVIVDAAMNDLVRPTLYDAYHDILPVPRRLREPPA